MTPRPGESRAEYVHRYLASDEAKRAYPDPSARAAVGAVMHANACGELVQKRIVKACQVGDHLELKADKKTRRIEGRASVFGNLDLERDIMLAGCAAESIERRGVGRIPLLWQHDVWQPIGKSEVLEEQPDGIHFVDRVSRIQRGDEALTLVDDGVIDGVSIGFEVLEARPGKGDDGGPVRLIAKIDLWEKSLVTFPANPAARVTGLKFARFGSGLYLPDERRAAPLALAMAYDAEGPASIAEVLGLLLDVADGNLTELVRRMVDETGLEREAVFEVISGADMCPTPAVVEGIARALAVDARLLFAAGARGGCDYALDADAPEETPDRETRNATMPGRMISKANADKIRAARDAMRAASSALDDLLKAAGEMDDEDDDESKSADSSPEADDAAAGAESKSVDALFAELDRVGSTAPAASKSIDELFADLD